MYCTHIVKFHKLKWMALRKKNPASSVLLCTAVICNFQCFALYPLWTKLFIEFYHFMRACHGACITDIFVHFWTDCIAKHIFAEFSGMNDITFLLFIWMKLCEKNALIYIFIREKQSQLLNTVLIGVRISRFFMYDIKLLHWLNFLGLLLL